MSSSPATPGAEGPDSSGRHRPTEVFSRFFLGLSPRVIGLAVVVGLLAGAVGAAYLWVLRQLQRGLWPAHWSGAVGFAVLGGAGLFVGLWVRVLGPTGNVELLVDNIHVTGGRSGLRELPALIPASLVGIAAGQATGPEAPLVQSTGTLGAWFGERWALAADDRRAVTIAGMAAGFAVLFGAPLGAAIFALEIPHRRGIEYTEALMPALVGALDGYAVMLATHTQGLFAVWDMPQPGLLHLGDFGWALLAGVLGAVIAIAFTYLVTGLARIFERIPFVVRVTTGGLVLAALALWSPYALTFGEAQIASLLRHPLLAGGFAIALLAKLVGTSVTVASGFRGGFIIPLFFMGCAGAYLVHAAFHNAPVWVMVPAMMSAANVGVTKTPLGSAISVSEMGGVITLPTTVLASIVSLMLTSGVGLIHTQRERISDGPGGPVDDLGDGTTDVEGGANGD